MRTLPSWSDGAAKEAIVRFVDDVTRSVPEEERIAVFDNDGTLWCEKPMPIELGFVLERLAELAAHDAALRDRQPWKAAHDQDHAWLSNVVTKHYAGDDTDLKVLLGGILQAFAGGPSTPALRLLLLHDDEEREFAYTAGAEKALEAAAAHGWTVISVKRDWASVFA